MIRHDEAHENESETSASANLIPPILGLIGVGLLAWGGWALGLIDNPSGDEFSHCAAIRDDRARLACYDKLSAPRQPAKGAVAPFHTRSHQESQ